MTTNKTHAKQVKTYGPKTYTENGRTYRITARVRFDDECRNGHNSFSVTGQIDEQHGSRWMDRSGGCIHEEVAKHFPELAPVIKWHLCDWSGPMHYVANTTYHVDEHGPTHAWVYYTGPSDPANLDGTKERLLTYAKAAEAQSVEGKPGYRVAWDAKTAKVRNLKHARSTAVWPDATDADLTEPGLEARLVARLPALLADFRAAVESLGLEWSAV